MILEQGIDAAFYDLGTLFERFALDAAAHQHPHFPKEAGGFGTVIVHADKGVAQMMHTDYEAEEIRSECDL